MMPPPCFCGHCKNCWRYIEDASFRAKWDAGRHILQRRWPKEGPVTHLVAIESDGMGDALLGLWCAEGVRVAFPDHQTIFACRRKNLAWCKPFFANIVDYDKKPRTHFSYYPYHSYNSELKARGEQGSRLEWYGRQIPVPPVRPDNSLSPIKGKVILCPNVAWPNRKYHRWLELETLLGPENCTIISDKQHITLKSEQVIGQSATQVLRRLKGASVVVAQDSGSAWAAISVGCPKVIVLMAALDKVFDGCPNVKVLRPTMDCCPCWWDSEKFRSKCQTGPCEALQQIDPREVYAEVSECVSGLRPLRVSLPTITAKI